MADNQVTLEINVDAKDAQKAIDQFGASAVKSVKSTEKSISSLSSAFTPIAATITAGIATAVGAFKAFDRAIEESIQTAKELKQIKFSLQATGEASDQAVQGIVDFSNAIKDATSVDDNLVRQLFVQAKAFGISTEQAQNLTRAAIDLAAATGMDVETALRQLGGTLDGSAGKINNLGVEFRNLSTEQLKNGDAIDLVNKKYGGAGAASLNTYEGATNTLSNAFGDLFENIGNIITQSDGVIKAVQVTANAINKSAELVSTVSGFFTAANRGNDADAKKFAELTRKKIDQIELIGNKSEAATPKVKNLIEQLNQTGGTSSVKGFETFGQTLQNISLQVVKSTGLTGRAAEDARKKFDDLLKSIQNAGESEIEIADRIRKERLKSLNESIKDGVGLEKEYAIARKKINQDFEKVVSKLRDEALEKQKKNFKEIEEAAEKAAEKEKKKADELRNYVEGLTRDPIKIFLDISAGANTTGEIIDNFKAAFEGAEFAGVVGDISKNLAASAAGVLNAALNGKNGATKLLGSIAGTFADRIIPGIGGVVSEIFGKLAAGKEQAKAFIKEFISSIPEIIKGVIEALPGILDAIIEVIGRPSFWLDVFKAVFSFYKAQFAGFIYQTLYESAFKGISAGFASASEKAGEFFSNIFGSIGEHFSNILANIGPQFAASIRGLFDNIGGPFGDALRKVTEPLLQGLNGLKSTFQPLIDVLNSVKEAFEKAGGVFGKGGGSGIIAETGGRIGKALGFSSGGVVPKYAASGMVARGSDTVPAMLTPGEMVVPRDMVGQLGSFLDGNGTGGKSEAILMAILQAVQQPVSVQSEVKVNQSVFADIILQLNRQNMRLSA